MSFNIMMSVVGGLLIMVSPLEGLVAGTDVVVANIACTGEMVLSQGESGILCEPHSAFSCLNFNTYDVNLVSLLQWSADTDRILVEFDGSFVVLTAADPIQPVLDGHGTACINSVSVYARSVQDEARVALVSAASTVA